MPVAEPHANAQPSGNLVLQLCEIGLLGLFQEQAADSQGKIRRRARGMCRLSCVAIRRRSARIVDRRQRCKYVRRSQQTGTEKEAGGRIKLHGVMKIAEVK